MGTEIALPFTLQYHSNYVDDSVATPYDSVISEVTQRRGSISHWSLAKRLHAKWGMTFQATLQSLKNHIENAGAWERLAMRGHYQDKLDRSKSTKEVRCSQMRDYLEAIGYSTPEQKRFFDDLRSIDSRLDYEVKDLVQENVCSSNCS